MSVIIGLLFSTFAFANSGKCPDWKHEVEPFNAIIKTPAVDCRAECKKQDDCSIQQDVCGRRFVINTKFIKEVSEVNKRVTTAECPGNIGLDLVEKAECANGTCRIQDLSCKESLSRIDGYFKDNFSNDCTKDSECSFLLKPNEKCLDYFPLNIVQKDSINQHELEYLKKSAVDSCLKNKPNFCGKKSVSQCFAKKCIQTEKYIPSVSFVNFEGADYKINFKSRTQPYRTPNIESLNCQLPSDCATELGVCSQYAVTLNKTKSAEFKKMTQKDEMQIACPKAGKIQIPKPDCVNNYCVFKE